MRFFILALLCVVFVQAAVAESWPRLSYAATDTAYAAPADTPRIFLLGELPDGEVNITSSGSYKLGSVRKVEVLANGDAVVSYRQDSNSDWWIVVTMGTATSVKASYWSLF